MIGPGPIFILVLVPVPCFCFVLTSPFTVLGHGPSPGPCGGPLPRPGPWPNLVPVPALVPVSSYFWSWSCSQSRAKFLVPSHSAHSISPAKGFLIWMSPSDPPKHHKFRKFPTIKSTCNISIFFKLSTILGILHYYTYDWYINAVFLCLVDNIRKIVTLQVLFIVM